MTFTYTVQPGDWVGVAPLVVLAVMALLVMLVDLVLPHAGEKSKHTGPANFIVLPMVSLLGVVGAIAATIVLFFVSDQKQVFNHMVATDPATLYAYLLVLSAGGLGILLSPAYLRRLNLVHQGEYYALLLFAMTGMMLMAAATSFVIVFVGLEMFSLALYILCGFVARRRASQESGIKYFLLSSFASAFLLYGIALTYAATGSTSFNAIAAFVSGHPQATTLLLVGLGLLSVGFAFKVSAVPFQSWTPDVYQGAPAPVTAFMSVGTKVAALLAFVRVFGFVLLPIASTWVPVIAGLAIITMIGGNIMALVQTNLKRLLGYSSIAHGGYLLIGVVVGGYLGTSAILVYLSCYLFMNLGAFGIVSVLERLDGSGNDSADLRGLWYRRPVLAGLLAFFLLSLAGFPPMAGFAAKYYIFYVALAGGHPELLIVGVLSSILGIYYYLRPIATMFMQREEAVAEQRTTGALTTTGRIPTTPAGAITRRPTGVLVTGVSTTAVAVRPSTKIARSPLPVEAVVEKDAAVPHTWLSWTAIAIAAIGTLVVGVLVPLWLTDIQHAASLLLK